MFVVVVETWEGQVSTAWLKEMKLPTLEERRERGDLIIIYKLMNLEETDEDLFLMAERETGYFRGHKKKTGKGKMLEKHKEIQLSTKDSRYMEWTKWSNSDSWECTQF